MNVFFREYNKVANSPEMIQKFAERKITMKRAHKPIDEFLKRACK